MRVPGLRVAALSPAVVALGIILIACSESYGPAEPVVRPPEPSPPAAPSSTPATIVGVSGDGQEGKPGEPLGQPFVVRVMDQRGDPLARVTVAWRVTEGEGELLPTVAGPPSDSLLTITDADGLVQAFFTPEAIGTSRIVASVPGLPGLQGSPVSFATHVPGLQLGIWLGALWGPCGYCSPNVTVALGTTVEWQNYDSGAYTLKSEAVPPGGASFRSGNLYQNDRFHFTPDKAGTWEYVLLGGPLVSSPRATLTVR